MQMRCVMSRVKVPISAFVLFLAFPATFSLLQILDFSFSTFTFSEPLL